jgi:hypothetical protein
MARSWRAGNLKVERAMDYSGDKPEVVFDFYDMREGLNSGPFFVQLRQDGFVADLTEFLREGLGKSEVVKDYAEPYWTTAQGEQIPISKLEDAHIVNIIKYCFVANRVPMREVLIEAANRKLLNGIGRSTVPGEGYVSPGQMIEKTFERG